MKNIVFAGIALAFWAIAACKNETSKSVENLPPGTKFICPMNCEKGKTYDQPGTCPVCNMKLEAAKTAAADAPKVEHFIKFVATPAALEAGKSALLSFKPSIRGNESTPVPLDLVHEKKMHLILVSDDLAFFDHIHPEFSAMGDYQIKVLGKGEKFTDRRGKTETRFDGGGKFWAFVDYKPTGGLNTVDKIEIAVAGAAAKPADFSKQKLTATVDGFTATLEPAAAGLKAGAAVHLPVSISKNGKAADPAAFENYLGEKAHVVLIETSTKEYLHTHPAAEGGKLQIHTTFPKAGMYRGWLQFQTDGVVHTADFVVKVD